MFSEFPASTTTTNSMYKLYIKFIENIVEFIISVLAQEKISTDYNNLFADQIENKQSPIPIKTGILFSFVIYILLKLFY